MLGKYVIEKYFKVVKIFLGKCILLKLLVY